MSLLSSVYKANEVPISNGVPISSEVPIYKRTKLLFITKFLYMGWAVDIRSALTVSLV